MFRLGTTDCGGLMQSAPRIPESQDVMKRVSPCLSHRVPCSGETNAAVREFHQIAAERPVLLQGPGGLRQPGLCRVEVNLACSLLRNKSHGMIVFGAGRGCARSAMHAAKTVCAWAVPPNDGFRKI